MKTEDDGKFEYTLMRPPEEALMVAFGLENDKRLSSGAKMFMGVLTAEHIEQVMGDAWLAWEVKRVLQRKYPQYDREADYSKATPFPNQAWGRHATLLCRVTAPSLVWERVCLRV